MTYCISIDWLSMFCLHDHPSRPGDPIRNSADWVPAVSDGHGEIDGVYDWQYKLEAYGTRQFARLHKVTIPNPDGGRDEFAEVQSCPYSKILNRGSIIVRFTNRALYMHDFWELADRFLRENHFEFKSISRIDICADFNQFATYDPKKLIEDFAGKKLRHVGRGVGSLYFNHGVMMDTETGVRDYGIKYNGLAFGTHSSDCRVYLYNKSFELLTQGDKPWIRDIWLRYGLDQTKVWRLEVSIKGKGCKFKCKQSGKKILINADNSRDPEEIATIYHSFVAKLFKFVKNRKGITNISREPAITLFDGHFHYIRGVIRNKTGAGRTEKMVIKALYQLGDLYRGMELHDMHMLGQTFAVELANSCDLNEWLGHKINDWEKPIHK